MDDRSAIDDGIIDIIQTKVGRPNLVILRTSSLVELGLESLDIVEIIFEIEERWKVEIPFNANNVGAFDMKTVGEIIDAVRKLLPND